MVKADQAIAFPALTAKSAGDPPFALSATASSGLPVSFDIVSGPAMADTNLVTLLGGGTVTVRAWQPGNMNYSAAVPVEQSFNVAKLAQTISFGPLSEQKMGDAPFPLSASASSELPVSFAVVSGPAVLSTNVVTLTDWGTVVIRASQAGDAIYEPAPDVDRALFVSPLNNTLVGLGFLPDGSFEYAVYGLVGTNYTVQASSNLLDWPAITNFISTNSPAILRDADATNSSQRFYRAVMP